MSGVTHAMPLITECLDPMEIHLLSVYTILPHTVHTTMRLNPLYLLPLALNVLGQNQVPYVHLLISLEED